MTISNIGLLIHRSICRR